MGSDNLFTKCKTCDTDVSVSAKACPKCGATLKKLSIIQWIVIAFLGLMIIGIFSPDNNSSPSPSSSSVTSYKSAVQHSETRIPEGMPEEQLKFIQTVAGHAAAYNGTKNELQQSVMRTQRKIDLSSFLGGYSASSWIGTITKLGTNSEGKAIFTVRISPEIEIKTWNNALSDMSSNTLIEQGSPVFNSLLDLSKGQKVKFSGNFFPSATDFLEETSMTIRGSMRSPEFLFRFKSVTPIN